MTSGMRFVRTPSVSMGVAPIWEAMVAEFPSVCAPASRSRTHMVHLVSTTLDGPFGAVERPGIHVGGTRSVGHILAAMNGVARQLFWGSGSSATYRLPGAPVGVVTATRVVPKATACTERTGPRDTPPTSPTLVSLSTRMRPKVSSIRKARREYLKWDRFLDKTGYDSRPSALSKGHTRAWRREAMLKMKAQYAHLTRRIDHGMPSL